MYKVKIVGYLCWFQGPLCAGNYLFTCGSLIQYYLSLPHVNRQFPVHSGPRNQQIAYNFNFIHFMLLICIFIFNL
jgi:hypothetical protein